VGPTCQRTSTSFRFLRSRPSRHSCPPWPTTNRNRIQKRQTNYIEKNKSIIVPIRIKNEDIVDWENVEHDVKRSSGHRCTCSSSTPSKPCRRQPFHRACASLSPVAGFAIAAEATTRRKPSKWWPLVRMVAQVHGGKDASLGAMLTLRSMKRWGTPSCWPGQPPSPAGQSEWQDPAASPSLAGHRDNRPQIRHREGSRLSGDAPFSGQILPREGLLHPPR
jgi:hypothetical protein